MYNTGKSTRKTKTKTKNQQIKTINQNKAKNPQPTNQKKTQKTFCFA